MYERIPTKLLTPPGEAFQQFNLSGDNGERDPPVPIPNTAVKPLSADGTWTAGSWESKSLPDFI